MTMKTITNERLSINIDNTLREMISDTLVYTSEVAEMWTGTLYEGIIGLKQSGITDALQDKDVERAYQLAYNLAQTAADAECKYEETLV